MQLTRTLALAAVALSVVRCGARADLLDSTSAGTGANAGAGGFASPNAGAGGSAASPSGGTSAQGGVGASSPELGGAGGGAEGPADSAPPADVSAPGKDGWDASGKGGKLKLPDASTPDVSDADGPGYVVIDGGNDCQKEWLGAVFAYQSCCNGVLCRGECVVFDGQQTPTCYCAGLKGGCPAPHHCCMATHCDWPDYCQ
ncbi:MAG: hypothetical protein IPI67_30020 [Myxococcales bacterium]|nr:hypothetical protein [Myxococcales bacterium]